MRNFQTIVPQNTVGQWVDAFNNNALAASDHTVYLGEILFSSVLYTGLETICGKKVRSLRYIDLVDRSPEEFYFDNWYCYFRNENKIKLIEHQNIDLSDYADNNLYFLFINSEKGYRVSVNSTIQKGDEIRICRFCIDKEGRFSQCYPTFQRFGYFGGNDNYPQIEGLDAKAFELNKLTREDGKINYNNIKFDFKGLPDSLSLKKKDGIELYYVNQENKVDFLVREVLDKEGNQVLDEDGNPVYTISAGRTVVESDYYIDYEKKEFKPIPINKFSILRILYDIYSDCYVIQPGNGYFDTLDLALDAVYSTDYPFPYTDTVNNIVGNAFPMIGVIVVKSNYTDLSDPEQCRIIQIRSRSTDFRDTELLATDSLARSLIATLRRDLDKLEKRITDCENRLDKNEKLFDLHIHNKLKVEDADMGTVRNPHKVTPEDLGLGSFRIDRNVDPDGANTWGDGVMYTPNSLPISKRTKDYIDNIKTDLEKKISALDNRFVKKAGDTMTGDLTISGKNLNCTGTVYGNHVSVQSDNYITVGGTRFYVGALPAGAPSGSYGVKG